MRPNTLVEGPASTTEAIIRALGPHVVPPVCVWKGAPPRANPGTLVIRDVARMSAGDQEELLAWLDGAGAAVRVLATSSVQVFPLIRRGRFLADLYYRLNGLRLVLRRRDLLNKVRERG